jgi:hypothetical protein
MNCKLILGAFLISLLIQSTPSTESQPPSSNTKIWPWCALGAATIGAGTWVYRRLNPSPEERFKQATLSFNRCMNGAQSNSMNQYNFPTECEEICISVALARDSLSSKQGAPTIQALIDSFKAK